MAFPFPAMRMADTGTLLLHNAKNRCLANFESSVPISVLFARTASIERGGQSVRRMQVTRATQD